MHQRPKRQYSLQGRLHTDVEVATHERVPSKFIAVGFLVNRDRVLDFVVTILLVVVVAAIGVAVSCDDRKVSDDTPSGVHIRR
ncbi:hypothetical protein CQ10_30005 [Bradyrhizobium valentinum]|nr:hypothetical protein CQ10_30005 [Bradyrhizobium valentinum]